MMESMFIGHLIKDYIIYKETQAFTLMGGVALYSSLAYSLWGDGASIVSKLGKGYDKQKILQ